MAQTATATNVLDTLRERGFVAQVSDEPAFRRVLDSGPITVYQGFDPTATSLHVGNLVGIMTLAHFQRAGHRPIAVVGGGTGMIGDPSDRKDTRPLLTVKQTMPTGCWASSTSNSCATWAAISRSTS